MDNAAWLAILADIGTVERIPAGADRDEARATVNASMGPVRRYAGLV